MNFIRDHHMKTHLIILAGHKNLNICQCATGTRDGSEDIALPDGAINVGCFGDVIDSKKVFHGSSGGDSFVLSSL